MITVRRSQERGHFDHGWLDTYHTFSFGRYVDRRHMGFRSLRVINDDRVAGGGGFGEHPHENMEIVTYVLSGALAHRDSLGNEESLRPGEVQRMTAGTGIHHAEYNASKTEPVHLLQVWLLPEREGLEPSYEQKDFTAGLDAGGLVPVVTADGADGSLRMRQDASVYAARLKGGSAATHTLAPGRHAWVQVARGAVRLNGTPLAAGDGASVSDERELVVQATEDAELLLFDLA